MQIDFTDLRPDPVTIVVPDQTAISFAADKLGVPSDLNLSIRLREEKEGGSASWVKHKSPDSWQYSVRLPGTLTEDDLFATSLGFLVILRAIAVHCLVGDAISHLLPEALELDFNSVAGSLLASFGKEVIPMHVEDGKLTEADVASLLGQEKK